MKSRGLLIGISAAAGALALVVVVIAAAVIGTNLSHSRQVDRADAAAALYNAAQARYRVTVEQILDQIDARDPEAGLRLLDGEIPTGPKLIPLSGYGPEHSRAYQQAAGGQELLDVDAIRAALANVRTTQAWADAAGKMLAPVDTYGVNGPQYNGTGIRSKVLAPLTKRFAEYRASAVPSGSESLDRQIRVEVASVLKQIEHGADQLDAGHDAPSFRYGFPRLEVLVTGQVARARAAVDTAIDAALTTDESAI